MIAFIYNGFGATLAIKAQFTVVNQDEINFSKSCSNERLFEIVLATDELLPLQKIAQMDILGIETDKGIEFLFIDSFNISSQNKGIISCMVGYGLQGLSKADNEIRISWGSSTVTDIVGRINQAYIDVTLDTPRPFKFLMTDLGEGNSGYVQAPDTLLPINQIFRQLYKQGFREIAYIKDNVLVFEIYKAVKTYTIRLEDILEYDYSFDKSTPTRLNLYKEVTEESPEILPPISVYLNNDNSITTFNNNIVKPPISITEIVPLDEFLESVAISKLRGMTYANELKVMIRDSKIDSYESIYAYSFIFEDNLFNMLGTNINIYMDNAFIVTVIDEVIRKKGTTTVIFGLSSTRVFDNVERRK